MCIGENAMPEQGFAISDLHEVRARFDHSSAMQEAISQLAVAGFDRADMSLPDDTVSVAQATPEGGAKEADTDEDARQARTVHTSTAASIAAMAAAGVTIATGGAALPAVAAAALAAGAVGGAIYAASSAANNSEQQDRDAKAADGRLILSVRASTPEQRSKAETILRSAGGMDIASS